MLIWIWVWTTEYNISLRNTLLWRGNSVWTRIVQCQNCNSLHKRVARVLEIGRRIGTWRAFVVTTNAVCGIFLLSVLNLCSFVILKISVSAPYLSLKTAVRRYLCIMYYLSNNGNDNYIVKVCVSGRSVMLREIASEPLNVSGRTWRNEKVSKFFT